MDIYKPTKTDKREDAFFQKAQGRATNKGMTTLDVMRTGIIHYTKGFGANLTKKSSQPGSEHSSWI